MTQRLRAPALVAEGQATNSIFSDSFPYKIIDLPEGHINDFTSGKHYFLPFLPATPSSPFRILEGLFETHLFSLILDCKKSTELNK